MATRRVSATARTIVLLGCMGGIVLCAGAVRAAEADAVTGSIGRSVEGSEWWRLRPAQAPTITVPETTGEALPEARRSVRMVYPAPYPTR